jgi:PadR family transcriptional regulator PadR
VIRPRLDLDNSISCITRYLSMNDSVDNKDTDKWEAQLRKGCLELAIMAALSGAKLYGLEILQRVESDSGLIIAEGTIYPLLSRLKALGLVETEWVESEAGHPRKYHALTPAGKKRVREMARTWERFSSSMSRLLLPIGKGR